MLGEVRPHLERRDCYALGDFLITDCYALGDFLITDCYALDHTLSARKERESSGPKSTGQWPPAASPRVAGAR